MSMHRQDVLKPKETSDSDTALEGDDGRPALRTLLHDAATAAFAPYQLNRIYDLALPAPSPTPALPGVTIAPLVDAEPLRRSPDRLMRRKQNYAGHGAWGYGAWVDGSLAAACWLWSHERCRNAVIDPEPGERALVDVYTLPEARGRGVGPALIAFAAADAARSDCTRLLAWIWWSNAASIRAFEKSGWRYRAFAYSFTLLGRSFAGRWTPRPRA